MNTGVSQTLIVVGGMQLGVGLLLLLFQVVNRLGKTRYEGSVLDHEPYESDGVTYYRPLIRYTTVDGRQHWLKYGVSKPTPLAVDGTETRVVWHHPSDPNKSHADSKLPFGIAIYFIGPVVLVTGLLLRYM